MLPPSGKVVLTIDLGVQCNPVDCSHRLLCPWDSLGKNTGVGCHALLHRIFPTQGLKPGLLHLPTLAGRFLTTSPVAQTVKLLPTMQKSWVRSLGREGPLEKEMAIHSSTLAWKIPWMEECGRL